MQIDNKLITITRDCDGVLIPAGEKIKLFKGTHVRITQALGGDYTLYVNGNLIKISGDDSDAIGLEYEYQGGPGAFCQNSNYRFSSFK